MADQISSLVSDFYDQYTYPNYPLFARPTAKASFHAFSDFAYNLHRIKHRNSIRMIKKKNYKKVLIAGCGDSQPLLMSKGEPKQNLLFGVDLSEQSIKKAELRLKIHAPLRSNFFFKRLDIQHDDISFNEQNTIAYDHIDAIGVLHHCSDPQKAIANLCAHLEEGGTMRVMVYNPFSRKFIDDIAESFRAQLKGRDILALTKKDFRSLRKQLEKVDHPYQEKLIYMKSILSHQQRFADTFLHPHAVSFGLDTWTRWFSEQGLTAYALFDRYNELDSEDRFKWPNIKHLNHWAENGRYLNNFEIFFVRNPGVAIQNLQAKTPLSMHMERAL